MFAVSVLVFIAFIVKFLFFSVWPGHVLADTDFAYRHPAVNWVYQCGRQSGIRGFWPMIIDNCLHGLSIQGDRVYVIEGHFGCMERGRHKPAYALDIKTGQILGYGSLELPGTEANYIDSDASTWDAVKKQFVIALGEDLVLRRPGNSCDMYLRYGNGAETRLLDAAIGNPDRVIRTSDDLLLLGSFRRHVVCIDLKKIDR